MINRIEFDSYYLSHIDETLKSVVEFNEERDGLHYKGHFHAIILKNGTLKVEFGKEKSSFAELITLMKRIQEAQLLEDQEAELLYREKSQRSIYRKSIFSSFSKITTSFRDKKRNFLTRLFFHRKIKDPFNEAQDLTKKVLTEQEIKLSQLPTTCLYHSYKRYSDLFYERFAIMNIANATFNRWVGSNLAKHYKNSKFNSLDMTPLFALRNAYKLWPSIIEKFDKLSKKLESDLERLRNQSCILHYFRIEAIESKLISLYELKDDYCYRKRISHLKWGNDPFALLPNNDMTMIDNWLNVENLEPHILQSFIDKALLQKILHPNYRWYSPPCIDNFKKYYQDKIEASKTIEERELHQKCLDHWLSRIDILNSTNDVPDDIKEEYIAPPSITSAYDHTIQDELQCDD